MASLESAGSSQKVRVELDSVASLAAARAAIDALLGLAPAENGLRSVAIGAPLAAVDALFSAQPQNAAVLWDPPEGFSLSGLGVATEIRVDLLSDKKLQVQDVFARLRSIGDRNAPLPRLIGGLSFAQGSASGAEWSAFGDGIFVLPRWSYVRDHDSAWLILSLADAQLSDVPDPAAQLHTELEGIWSALLWRKPSSVQPQHVDQISHTQTQSWQTQVDAIRQRIADGKVQKIVAARRSEVELGGDVDVLGLLANLEARYPECTRFALWRDEVVFLGASPEKLINRYGREVSSEALAGSVPKGQQEALLSSDKERLEHQLVVEAISNALSSYCDELRIAAEPRVVELPNLLHMQTPIEGHLSRDVHVLDLVATLHPTPAVGGVPREAALSWIQEHEETSRGWYSAPFGWIDADGDGEFLVALRSGLVHKNKVWIYAGAGIMQDSDPQAEYNETALKMQALLGAFDGSR